MHYFVLENIFTFNSGTEHAAMNRVQLFNQQGVPARIATRNYNRFLNHDMDLAGVDPKHVINMYDFFQGTTATTRTEQPLRLLPQFPLDEYHIVANDGNSSQLKHAGRDIADIEVMPGTVGLVSTVTYRDRFNNPTVRENFDWRGFKSSVDYFHPGGELATQQFLALDGTPVLEITHMNIDGQVAPTMWKLLNYKGRNYRFNFEDQLFLFFLNELTAADQEAVVWSERRSLDYVVADVRVTTKWAVLHDTHLVKPSDAKSDLLAAYDTLLENRADDYTGVLVLTETQQAQLTQRYPGLNVQVIPDIAVSEEALSAGRTSDREPIVLVMGRLAPDKRPEDALAIFVRVHQTHPAARLHFVGYPESADYRARLKDQVAKAGVEAAVVFTDYLTGDALAAEFTSARVLLNTSAHEGLGMHLIEAQAAGVPVVAYNTPYGARRLIRNHQNGQLIPAGNVSAAAQAVTTLLTDDKSWHKQHDDAQKKAREFLPGAVMKGFQTVLNAKG